MKPSKIQVLKAKKALFLFPGFRALTWKGIAYCKKKSDIQLINFEDKISSDFESHEMVHVKQAESTHDSWFCFYALYLWYWILNFPLFIAGLYMPYFFIPFELEAMNNETNWNYPTNDSVYQWKEFRSKLSLKKKYSFAKDYKKNYKGIGFKLFVREVIYPLIMRTS
jgi:hypothetical protein